MAMLESLGKLLANRVISALVLVGSAGAVIYFWRNPDDLAAIWDTIKYVLVWIGFVLVLPWATFFVPRWVMKKDSNVAAGLMLAGYSAADIFFAVVLLGGIGGHSALVWAVLILGFLAAGVYNFVACEYQAERWEDR